MSYTHRYHELPTYGVASACLHPSQPPQSLPGLPLPLREPIMRALPIMLGLGADEKHQHLLPWDGMPDDVLLIHVCLEWGVGGLLPLRAYRFNADSMAGTTTDLLADPGDGFHRVPDSSSSSVIISICLVGPLNAINKLLGV